MKYTQDLYFEQIRDLASCLTTSGYEDIGHLKRETGRKKWCIRFKDFIADHVRFFNKCSEGYPRRMQLSFFVFAATESFITKLMGKGEAAARRELMELHGDSVEVDV